MGSIEKKKENTRQHFFQKILLISSKGMSKNYLTKAFSRLLGISQNSGMKKFSFSEADMPTYKLF